MVTQAQPSRRWPAYTFCALFALGGALLLALALPGLLAPLDGLRARAAIIELQPHDAFAIGLAVSLFAFAAMTLLPERRPDAKGASSRTPGGGSFNVAALLLAVAFVGLGLSFVASPVSELVANRLISQRGYLRCPPAKVWHRHAPIRWALPSARCP